MKSMKSKLTPIRDMLVGLLPNATYHYWRKVQKKRYIIWAEDTEYKSHHSDNKKQEQQITGIIDLYTQTEYDSLADDIQDGLTNLGVGWSLVSVNYEQETKFIHWQWEFRTA